VNISWLPNALPRAVATCCTKGAEGEEVIGTATALGMGVAAGGGVVAEAYDAERWWGDAYAGGVALRPSTGADGGADGGGVKLSTGPNARDVTVVLTTGVDVGGAKSSTGPNTRDDGVLGLKSSVSLLVRPRAVAIAGAESVTPFACNCWCRSAMMVW